MSSCVARERIIKLAKEHREYLIEKFKAIEYFSATSDIWTRSNQSFIAVSVHYIDPRIDETVRTQYIACELFQGTHTNDRVAAKLSGILSRFGILQKVFFITTDGDSKYVAAFKFYGDNYRNMTSYLYGDDEWLGDANASDAILNLNDADANDTGLNDADSNESDNDEDLNLFTRIDLEDEEADNSDSESDCDETIDAREGSSRQTTTTVERTGMEFRVKTFPSAAAAGNDDQAASNSNQSPIGLRFNRVLQNINRIACSSHALDKVGSKDARKAKKNAKYKSIYNKVMNKLKQLWKLKRKRKEAEIFKRITDRKLIGPHRIRWLSKYDIVSISIHESILANSKSG